MRVHPVHPHWPLTPPNIPAYTAVSLNFKRKYLFVRSNNPISLNHLLRIDSCSCGVPDNRHHPLSDNVCTIDVIVLLLLIIFTIPDFTFWSVFPNCNFSMAIWQWTHRIPVNHLPHWYCAADICKCLLGIACCDNRRLMDTTRFFPLVCLTGEIYSFPFPENKKIS